MSSLLNKRIATQIRVYRKHKKMTLENLSNKADIDDIYLGRVERGEINITLSTLEKIIDGLGMTEAEFFSFLDLESDDPTLAKLMREVKQSSKRDKLTKTIQEIIDLSK